MNNENSQEKEIISFEIISLDQNVLFDQNMNFDPNLGFVPFNEL